MIIGMRTTLVLDDDLLRRAKHRAAERNLTVSDVVNQALRAALSDPAPTPLPFTMPTYGAAGPPVRHEPSDFDPTLEDEASVAVTRR
jgi:hypothetical protein